MFNNMKFKIATGINDSIKSATHHCKTGINNDNKENIKTATTNDIVNLS